MNKIKVFFKNLFRKGKPCMYCRLKTESVRRLPGSVYTYRVCDECYEKNKLDLTL